MQLEFSPSYSPWFNRVNERNQVLADKIVKKVMMTDPKMTIQEAVNLVGQVYNTNMNKVGYSPMQLFIEKSVLLPRYVKGNRETERNSNSELIERLINNKREEFNEITYRKRCKKFQSNGN